MNDDGGTMHERRWVTMHERRVTTHDGDAGDAENIGRTLRKTVRIAPLLEVGEITL
jgi:hypothetical protein